MASNSIKKYKTGRIRRLLKISDDELSPYFAYHLGEIDFVELSEKQREKLARYTKIWSQLMMGRPQQMVLSAIMKEYGISTRQAQYDLSFSVQLHGPLDQVNKDARRAASREFFDLLSQLAMKDKQYPVAVMARKEADTLAGLHKEEKEGFDPSLFEKPSKIVFNVQVNNNYTQASNIVELDE